MIAFHGSEELKGEYVSRMAAHAEADELVQGTGWENGKGCFVGCTLHRYDHSLFPEVLGIPEWLARLCDAIFEGLAPEDAKWFATAFFPAVPVGADLEPIRHQFLGWLCKRNRERVESLEGISEELRKQVIEAIQMAEECHARPSETARSARLAAESAAWAAAESAARAAARAAAESAARAEYKIYADMIIYMISKS